MNLVSCNICGKVFTSDDLNRDICHKCINHLEDIYSEVHDYIKNHAGHFNVRQLTDYVEMTQEDFKTLEKMGYFERDMQVYGHGKLTARQKLARKIENELDKMSAKLKLTTYGGMIYKRKKL